MAKIDQMLLFAEVVKAGGLAAAGRKLGLSPASMTARIKQIEQHYQTRLLIRNTRSVRLTDAGERFYQGCLRVADEVQAAESHLHRNESELLGSLNLTAPADFGRRYVAPAVADFVALHPKVVPNLMLGDGVVDLIREGVDLAVRLGELPDSGLIAKPICDNPRVLCAAPEYLDRAGVPATPQDLKSHACLVMQQRGELQQQWYFSAAAPQPNESASVKVRVDARMSCSDGGVVRDWALAGLGVAIKSWVDVAEDIRRGTLVRLLPDWRVDTQLNALGGLHFVYPSRHYQLPQVQAFMAFFINRFNQ